MSDAVTWTDDDAANLRQALHWSRGGRFRQRLHVPVLAHDIPCPSKSSAEGAFLLFNLWPWLPGLTQWEQYITISNIVLLWSAHSLSNVLLWLPQEPTRQSHWHATRLTGRSIYRKARCGESTLSKNQRRKSLLCMIFKWFWPFDLMIPFDKIISTHQMVDAKYASILQKA